MSNCNFNDISQIKVDLSSISGVAKGGRGGAIASKTILAKSLNPYSSWGGGGVRLTKSKLTI